MTKAIIRLFLIFGVLLPLAACDMGSAPRLAMPMDASKGYQLGPGDQLRIVIFGHEEMSGQFYVNSTGFVSLPLIREIKAAGMTAPELEQAITDALGPKYIQDPRVSVEVTEYRPIYILGEVRTPGKYAYIPDMTVLKAVAIAGGHTYRANENSAEITRDDNGRIDTLELGPSDIIEPGDTVLVKRRWF